MDGLKNGKGKEYWTNGKLKFEGKYLNDEKHGKFKEYNSDGKFKSECEFVDGNKIN